MSYQRQDQDDVLNGFNPFEHREPTVPIVASGMPRPVFTAAVLPESPKPSISKNETAIREIEQRERALNDLERKIQSREEELNKQDVSKSFGKMNNFPPIPTFCPCKPCFYQDCDVEIAEEYRSIVKLGLIIWLAYTILLFINLFGTLSFLIAGVTSQSDGGTMFGVSLLLFIVLPILGYVLWFRPLYRAFRSGSSVNFFIFFLFFGILICILIIQSLGINVLGSCGWINSLTTLKVNTGISIFMIIIAIGFTCTTLVSVFLFIKVHRTYRTTGASFTKAKDDMRNKTVSAALHA